MTKINSKSSENNFPTRIRMNWKVLIEVVYRCEKWTKLANQINWRNGALTFRHVQAKMYIIMYTLKSLCIKIQITELSCRRYEIEIYETLLHIEFPSALLLAHFWIQLYILSHAYLSNRNVLKLYEIIEFCKMYLLLHFWKYTLKSQNSKEEK